MRNVVETRGDIKIKVTVRYVGIPAFLDWGEEILSFEKEEITIEEILSALVNLRLKVLGKDVTELLSHFFILIKEGECLISVHLLEEGIRTRIKGECKIIIMPPFTGG